MKNRYEQAVLMKAFHRMKAISAERRLSSAKLTEAKPPTTQGRMFLLSLICCGASSGLAMAADQAAFFVMAPVVVVAPALLPRILKEIAPVKIPIAAVTLPKRANFEDETVSEVSRYLADWVVDSNDNQNMPFVVVDKKAARVFVFNVDGKLLGSAPALLGLALGDHAIAGIGNMSLASIRPEQRTTPAGRFVAALGRNLGGKEILWVDYDGAISLHRVVTSSIKERRLQRLASNNPSERRISYGCINVPVKFYDSIISPTFSGTQGVVYVLPDTLLVQEVFGSYDVSD